MLKHYLRLGFRNLRKYKSNSLVNIAGLSMGISVVLLIAIFANNELSVDRFHANSSNIYKVSYGMSSGTPGPLSGLLKQEFPEITDATHIETRQLNGMSPVLIYNGEPIEMHGYYSIDSCFFNVFDFEVLRGDISTALQAPFSMILTESEAARIFGDIDPLGQVVTWKGMNDFQFTIQAIVKDVPANSSIVFNGLITDTSVRKMSPHYPDNWGYGIYETYLLLHPGIEAARLEEKLRSFLVDYYETSFSTDVFYDDARSFPLSLHALRDVYFSTELLHDTTTGGNLFLIRVLIGTGLIILLLSFVNYINLSTAMGSLRKKEIGIQKVFGSARSQLVFQYLTETVLLSFLATAIAVVITLYLLPVFSQFIGMTQHLKFPVSFFIVLFLGIIILGIVAGIYPAFFMSTQYELAMLIKDTGPGAKGKKLRYLLVIFQFTISIVLIAFTILINQQVNYMKKKDTGISKEHIIYARLPHQLFLNEKERFTERLEAVPGVQQVSYSSRVFGEINDNGSVEVDGKTLKYKFVWVDAAFIGLFDLELMEGRFFSKAFTSDRNATALLNETAVGAFGLDDPLDLKIRVPGGNAQVVGIVKDFNFKSLHHAIEPLAIIYFPGQGIHVNIKCYGQDMPHTIKEIEKIWKELSSEFPFNYHYLETSFNHLYQGDEKIGKAILYASLVAIFIAIMGVLSLSLFLCQSKEKEIGIRKINGAKEWEVIRNLNKAFFYNVLIAFVIACPLAWYIMVQWLENFAYKTSIHVWIFILSGCVVAFISISIVSLQSWRFARQNPADTLRNE